MPVFPEPPAEPPEDMDSDPSEGEDDETEQSEPPVSTSVSKSAPLPASSLGASAPSAAEPADKPMVDACDDEMEDASDDMEVEAAGSPEEETPASVASLEGSDELGQLRESAGYHDPDRYSAGSGSSLRTTLARALSGEGSVAS